MKTLISLAVYYYNQKDYLKYFFIIILLTTYTKKKLYNYNIQNSIKKINLNKISLDKCCINNFFNFICILLHKGVFFNNIIQTIEQTHEYNIFKLTSFFCSIKNRLIDECIKTPLISIIIPTFNSSQYIIKSLKSIQNQTFHSFQVICIDDCSQDDTIDKIKLFTNCDSRFLLIEQKQHRGPGVARNTGLKYVKGKFITFLDSDDQYLPNTLNKAILKAQSENSEIVTYKSYSNLQNFNYSNNSILSQNLDHRFYNDIKQYKNINLNIFQFFTPWCWDKIFNYDFIKNNQIKFQNIKNSEDNLFVYSSIINAKKISFINEELICHNKTQNSLENTKYKNPYCFIESLLEIESFLIRTNKLLFFEKSFINKVCNNIYYNINKININNVNINLIIDLIEHFKLPNYEQSYFYNKNYYLFLLKIFNEHKTCRSIDLSIIITFCNQKKYIKQCIDSILNQKTNYSYELLICLDGEDDGSWEILNNYYKKKSNIKLFKIYSDSRLLSLCRASQNRLFLLKHAIGDFFITLDGDDFFCDQNRFEEGLKFLKKNNNFIAHLCKHNLYNETQKKFIFLHGHEEILTLDKYISKKMYIHISCGIFKNIFKIYNFPYKYFFNDTTLMYYMLSKGNAYFSAKTMFSYRIGISSTFTSIKNDDKKFLSFIVDIYKLNITKNNFLKNKLKSDFKYFVNNNICIDENICNAVKYQKLKIAKDIINFYKYKSIFKYLYKLFLIIKFNIFINFR